MLRNWTCRRRSTEVEHASPVLADERSCDSSRPVRRRPPPASTSSSTPAGGKSRFEPLGELGQTDSQYVTDFAKRDDVQSPLAGLVLADEGLRLSDPCGDIGLPQALLPAKITKQLSQYAPLRIVSLFLHVARPGERASLEPGCG